MMDNALLESELNELYKEVKKGEKIGRVRRWSAYALKIIAAGSGLAIATGKLSFIDQELGIAVLIAVFIDQVFSNHLRLIAEAKAAHAYRALSRRVKAEYNSKRNPIAKKANEGDVSAAQELENLMQVAHSMLKEGISDIEKYLAEVDIKALQMLSLDSERKTTDK